MEALFAQRQGLYRMINVLANMRQHSKALSAVVFLLWMPLSIRINRSTAFIVGASCLLTIYTSSFSCFKVLLFETSQKKHQVRCGVFDFLQTKIKTLFRIYLGIE